MKKASAPVPFFSVLGLVVALTVSAAGQTQTTGQTPTGQTPTSPQTGAPASPQVPGAEQPAGSPVLVAPPTPLSAAPSPRPAPQPSTPYNLGAVPRAERPSRTVYGVPSGNKEPVLTLDALVGGGLSGDPAANQLSGAPAGGLGAEGGSGAVTASSNLVYSAHWRRVGINATNIVHADYYPQYTDAKFQPRTIASFAVDLVPFKSTRLTISEGYKNLPELSFSELQDPDFGLAIPLNQDLPIRADRYSRIGSNVDVSHKLSKRAQADFSVGHAKGVISGGSNWTTISMSANFNYTLAKGVGAYVGYIFGEQIFHDHAGRESTDRHPATRFGIDYSRAISFARRTSISFSTGLSQIDDKVQQQTQYSIVGAAAVKREFGRTWETGFVYSRNNRFIETLAAPVLNDSISVIAQGSFSRRVQLKAGFGASAGHLGASTSGGFDTFFGSAQVSVGLTRNFGLGADYSYSRLANPLGDLPIAATGLYSQGSARVYLKIWTPLITKPRRP